MQKALPALVSILFCSFPAFAQTSTSIVHLGYQADRPAKVAPGQVLHLTLHGLTTVFDATQVATTIPLPTDFNGLSVSLQQSGTAQPQLPPLLHGQGSSSCSSSVPLSNLIDCPRGDLSYDLLVQIPFELRPNVPGADNNGPCISPSPTAPCMVTGLNDAVLTVQEKSGQGMSFRIYPVMDQIHLLNTCTDNIDTLGLTSPSVYLSSPCFPLILHGDNSWVTASKPARPGEVLVAYAFGLGLPATSFPTLSATPTGGVVVNRPFAISFIGATSQSSSAPDYVGLVGGNAGLYQINFRVPIVSASLPPCTPAPALLTKIPSNPSNLTVTISGTSSLDQASFCVQP